MTIQLRVTAIEPDPNDAETYRILFTAGGPDPVTILVLRVTRAALTGYGLGTWHTVTVALSLKGIVESKLRSQELNDRSAP